MRNTSPIGLPIGKGDRPLRTIARACAAPERITKQALTWIGTPYRHQMSLKGVGCDCIGLVRGVWREVYGAEPCALSPYSPDWAEVDPDERLLAGLARYFTAVDEARPGDVLAFRMKSGAAAKHVAVLSYGTVDGKDARIVHAYWGHAVVESWLGPYWRRHVVGAFRFP